MQSPGAKNPVLRCDGAEDLNKCVFVPTLQMDRIRDLSSIELSGNRFLESPEIFLDHEIVTVTVPVADPAWLCSSSATALAAGSGMFLIDLASTDQGFTSPRSSVSTKPIVVWESCPPAQVMV